MNLSEIKITKVKPWSVYFQDEKRKYLLHENTDDDIVTTLYERIDINGKGRYKLKYISSCYGRRVINWCNQQKHPYSFINRDDFIWELTWVGLIKSKYSNEIKNCREKK